MLNTTVSACPMGLPFALKMREVAPMSEAHSVR